MMSNIHFIGGEKGGVGKSMTARLLAQYLIDKGIPFIGFDSDQSHGTFSRFYREFASPLVVDSYDSLDQLILLAQENPESDLIVDLAAQTSTRLGKWIDESDALALFQEIGSQVYMWHVLDDGADSVNLLSNLLDRYPQDFIKFVVVSNLGRGECFDHFEQSAVYQKAKDRNAAFLTLTKLQPQLAARIDFSNTSFWAAANSADVMNIIERSRVRVWLKNNYQQFDKLAQ
jgi:ATPases involved in chromosome partitioning